MTSIDIYNILTQKPHNPHYLKRYWKFILGCQEKNRDLPKDTYTENHHICPKAKDLFPEYKSFKTYSWNKIKLTLRQHVLAHVLLAKTYGGSQLLALEFMTNNFEITKTKYLSSLIEKSTQKRKGPKTEHHKKKISEGVKKYYKTEEAKLKRSITSKNLWKSAEYRNKFKSINTTIMVFLLENTQKCIRIKNVDFDEKIYIKAQPIVDIFDFNKNTCCCLRPITMIDGIRYFHRNSKIGSLHVKNLL